MPDILSQDEIDALLSVTSICVDRTFGKEDYSKSLEKKIDNYGFKEGQWIYIQWRTECGSGHVLKDDALFGFIASAGKDIGYLTKKGVHIPYEAEVEARPDKARKLKVLFNPGEAASLNDSGLRYEPGTRILVQGVSLNPYDFGDGFVGRVEKFPRLYKHQREGQLLMDTNYLKAVHAEVYLDEFDISLGLERNNKGIYCDIIEGTLSRSLDARRRELLISK